MPRDRAAARARPESSYAAAIARICSLAVLHRGEEEVVGEGDGAVGREFDPRGGTVDRIDDGLLRGELCGLFAEGRLSLVLNMCGTAGRFDEGRRPRKGHGGCIGICRYIFNAFDTMISIEMNKARAT